MSGSCIFKPPTLPEVITFNGGAYETKIRVVQFGIGVIGRGVTKVFGEKGDNEDRGGD